MGVISSVTSQASQLLQQLRQLQPQPLTDSDGDGDNNAPDVATATSSGRALDILV